MNRTLFIAVLTGIIILIVYGISASESISSDFSRFFTGKPTEETIWLPIGGIIACAIGAGGLLRGTTPP